MIEPAMDAERIPRAVAPPATRVLVVDDSLDNLRLLTAILEREGL